MTDTREGRVGRLRTRAAARTGPAAKAGSAARTGRAPRAGAPAVRLVAPDPGLLRLRTALRAVLGVGLAVGVCTAAGAPVDAVVAGGLAALLALFTVADARVRDQAVTTALLPVAGFPVLALAAALHDLPAARDAAFVAVVLGGVYARRWGPRGHALGVFAFMMYFLAQFLEVSPRPSAELCAAVSAGLLCAAAVRFGPLCFERRAPAPATVLPAAGPQPRGAARPTTRQAVQAAVAAAAALAIGQAVSHERWYWAVGTAWWVFVNTSSAGETLVRGFRRIVGTVCGIVAGLAVALPVDGAPGPTAAVVALCVFGIFYTAPVSYSWMIFCVTVMVGLLYGLLGVLHPGLLVLRLQETAIGAAAAVTAALTVLPNTTHALTHARIEQALRAVRAFTADASRRLSGTGGANPARHVEELELLLGQVRLSLAPLVHPLSPLRARRARARRVLELLDACAVQVRGLAEVVADPVASHDERLTAAFSRVEHAVRRLLEPEPGAGPVPGPGRTAVPVPVPVSVAAPEGRGGGRAPHAEQVLAHLHGLEDALAGLEGPVLSAPGARPAA
ncbi:FUSC family protein [Streptomyces thermolineatus]|uniref:FUSC family protein n=1 Tax=Streptomyces thermolineatus TaxID=44033 RepID=UPI0031D5B47F